ncbi:hypothetical protein ED733_008419 [Metarhizium rileyi]|uniref:Negative acting factor n=1 Tax=Metarhizium rileyi (strain RCEF 4871) TaxID=1649241 RepID=A0A5C6GLE2_METRR|nr:hypothetical protein ED733_008419 [Metarhizium rileyi]
MSAEDESMAQDAAAGVGSDPPPAPAPASAPGNAATTGATTISGSGPKSDITTPGTAAAAPVVATTASASSSALHNLPSRSISPSQSPSIVADSTGSTAPTTTFAVTLANTTAASDSISGPAPITNPESAIHISSSSFDSPATLAAADSPATPAALQSQQNGDSKASEADSDMNSYRPVLTAHDGLSVSYSTATTSVSTSSHAAAASPSVNSAHASPTGASPTQYSSYPTIAPRGTTPIKQEPAFDFATSIDPASRHLPPPTSGPDIKPFDYKTLATVDSSRHSPPNKMKIDEIINLLGPPPPPQQISHTEETFNEITKVYHEMYAGGLSAFLETSWYYFIENGKMSFPRDANLIEHMATFLKILEAVRANDHSQMAYSGVLETRIVWELACIAYQFSDGANQTSRTSLPPEGDSAEARNRLRVVEALLCGEYLATNPLTPPLQDPEPHRTRQFDFWYSLAEFVIKRESPDSHQAIKARDDALGRMRHLLDGRENRDVLYSIAVVRELAPYYGPSYGNTPQYADETDPKNRLAVASKFILDEAQVTGGTTNVVRRFSDIASRAFVNPGVNVARRTG